MNCIPPKLKAEMAADPFYLRCCVTGEFGTRYDPIEWHHNLIYGGKQVQEKFAILPLKRSLHAQANAKTLRDRLNWVMLSRATWGQLQQYSKAVDLQFELNRLETLFGVWAQSPVPVIHY